MAIEDNESTNWIIEITEEKRLDCLVAYSWVALEKIRNSISADPEIEAWPEGKDRIASWIAYVYLSYTSGTLHSLYTLLYHHSYPVFHTKRVS